MMSMGIVIVVDLGLSESLLQRVWSKHTHQWSRCKQFSALLVWVRAEKYRGTLEVMALGRVCPASRCSITTTTKMLSSLTDASCGNSTIPWLNSKSWHTVQCRHFFYSHPLQIVK